MKFFIVSLILVAVAAFTIHATAVSAQKGTNGACIIVGTSEGC